MSVYLTGEFRERDAVKSAIVSLRAGGLDANDLDLYSEEPVELPRSVLHRPSRMSLASAVGAIATGGLATAFIWWTQHTYRLVTGGMPVFSWWATGVITYEMVMLGAILATLLWFLRESGLGRGRDRKRPVPELRPGSLCLRVRCRPEQVPRITETMRGAGALEIERSGP